MDISSGYYPYSSLHSPFLPSGCLACSQAFCSADSLPCHGPSSFPRQTEPPGPVPGVPPGPWVSWRRLDSVIKRHKFIELVLWVKDRGAAAMTRASFHRVPMVVALSRPWQNWFCLSDLRCDVWPLFHPAAPDIHTCVVTASAHAPLFWLKAFLFLLLFLKGGRKQGWRGGKHLQCSDPHSSASFTRGMGGPVQGIYSTKSQGWIGVFPVVRKGALCLKLRAVCCSDCLRIASCCLVGVFSSRQAFMIGFCLQACVTFAHCHSAKDRSIFVIFVTFRI